MGDVTAQHTPVFLFLGDDAQYELYEFVHANAGTLWTDRHGNEFVSVGRFIDGTADFYQGINMVTVFRDSSGRLWGFPWWDDISKYGEPYIESNHDPDEPSEEEYEAVQLAPVHESTIRTYSFD